MNHKLIELADKDTVYEDRYAPPMLFSDQFKGQRRGRSNDVAQTVLQIVGEASTSIFIIAVFRLQVEGERHEQQTLQQGPPSHSFRKGHIKLCGKVKLSPKAVMKKRVVEMAQTGQSRTIFICRNLPLIFPTFNCCKNIQWRRTNDGPKQNAYEK